MNHSLAGEYLRTAGKTTLSVRWKPLPELKMPESTDFYNVTTLAQHLGVSTQTIRRWIRSGKLPAPIVLSPTVRRWKKTEIESWLETFEQSASMKSSSSHA